MDQPPGEPLIIDRPMHPAGRVVLGALGAGAIALSAYELWPAFSPPGWWSLPFGVILGGAIFVGGMFIAGALFGTAEQWQIHHGVVTVTVRHVFGQRCLRLSPAEIATIAVETETWDSRADTYSVVLTTTAGERFKTRSFSTAEAAERVRADVLERINRPGALGPRAPTT